MGINEEILGKIFEAYFTTKHKAQGTGLGLNMTYNMIVNDMKGNVKAYNDEYVHNGITYKGATFKISLPLEI